MQIILRYPTLRRVEGILLSATADTMRVVERNESDTLELHFIGGQWFSEQGSQVEIESLIADDPNAIVQIWHEARPRVGAAGC